MNNLEFGSDMQQEINKIKEQLLAGRVALDKQELGSLLFAIEKHLNEICETDLFGNDFKSIQKWNEIFDYIYPAQIAYDLMNKIDSDIYYRFGNYLLEKLSNSQGQNYIYLKNITHSFLDLFRLPELLKRIYGQKKWEVLIHKLVLLMHLLINNCTMLHLVISK